MSGKRRVTTGWTDQPRLRRLRCGLLAATLAGAGTLATPLAAQVAPGPLTREELEQGQANAPVSPRGPRLSVEGDIERGPCPLADPAYAATRVNFSSVAFDGPDGLDLSVLRDSWRDMAGQDLPIAALCDVRDRAATALRARGYLAAVQIPPQRIEQGGTVRMQVMAARLVEVQVRGDAGPSETVIADYLKSLTGQQFFNTHVAERQLLLLGDMPGYQVRLTLKPVAGKPGDVVGDLLVERRPFELVAGVQNLASKGTGREGGFVQLALNGLTGLADRTTFSAYSTLDFEEQWVLQASHEFGLGASGLRLGASALWGQSRPANAGPFKTESLAGDIYLSYPVLRTRTANVRATGGLEIVDQKVDFGAVALTRDKLRILYGRLAFDSVDEASLLGRGGYTLADPRWRLAGLVEARKGLSILGASDDCSPVTDCTAPNVPISDFNARPDALVLRAQASAEFRPVPEVTLAATPRAQWANHAVLSYEGFSVGNYTVGRGYDPGALIGDSGIGSSFELRVGRLYNGGVERKFAFQPFAFLDAAWVWNRDDGVATGAEKAFSAGGGLRMRWGNMIDADLTVAAPLKRTVFQPERGDVRVLFTIKARLLPWDPS